MLKCHVKNLLAACTLLFAVAPMAFGQGGTQNTAPPIVGGAPYIEAWVDGCAGGAGAVNCPDQPFSTIQAAINAVAALGPNANNPGLVHVNPGVYSPFTNGETLPIRMADFVNVQGVGAKRCIIRGLQTQAFFNIFWPRNSDCVCGARSPGEILVDFTFLTDPSYAEMIDGMTFQGGDVQVYAETEGGPIAGTVSNCVFDMLEGADHGAPSPAFGVLMIHTYDFTSGGVYWDIPMNFLNNTFIQGWQPNEDMVFTARPDNVAIVDVNDPACWATPDPDPSLRGIGNPNIQNNLIRYICEQPRTAMLGIDNTDTSAQIATRPGPSNAFDPAMVGGVDLTGSWCSRIPGAAPIPRINPNPASGGLDPVFVGEFLSNGLGYAFNFARDWRILSDSPMVDQGTAAVNGVLSAVNGTAYVDRGWPERSTDFDGEVYGNFRVMGENPDIGMDETHDLIHAGGFANDTRSLQAGCGCVHPGGTAQDLFIFSGPGTFDHWRSFAFMPYNLVAACLPAGANWAFTTQFGTLVPPANAPGWPVTYDWIWIQTTPLFPGIIPYTVGTNLPIPFARDGYTPPCESKSYNVNWAIPQPVGAGCIYQNDQVIFYPQGGAPARLSNLQQSYGN